ncbi:MAG: hypothetical protein WCH05_04675 [Chlorobiaceae bacterium]
MKKMLSFAAMIAALSYASPASAELKFGGDASTRLRGQFGNTKSVDGVKDKSDDLLFQYRIRLNGAADLGGGYFFKTMIMSEETAGGVALGGGWSPVGVNNSGAYNLEVSNFVFGRMMKDSHYMVGRIPLNSVNNPIFDLTQFAIPTASTILSNNTGVAAATTIYAVDIPVATFMNDRVYGLNYGTKVGDGELNATVVVLDNFSTDNKLPDPILINGRTKNADGLFNDGYILHLSYKTNLGDVTVEPQALISLTDVNGVNYTDVSPNTFGANATVPVGKSKLGFSGFYTLCKDKYGVTPSTGLTTNVDYSGYLVRAKAESGPVTAWIDFNKTTNRTPVADVEYNNMFIWAQYKVNVHESATGTFSVTPTVRYRASSSQAAGAGKAEDNQLRTELYATVTF